MQISIELNTHTAITHVCEEIVVTSGESPIDKSNCFSIESFAAPPYVRVFLTPGEVSKLVEAYEEARPKHVP